MNITLVVKENKAASILTILVFSLVIIKLFFAESFFSGR